MAEIETVLLKRFADKRDPEAFCEIVRRYAGLVYGACLRVLSDQDRSADAAQETFFQLVQNAEHIKGSLGTWLHTVATRKAIDELRRDSARRHRELRYAEKPTGQIERWDQLSPHVDEALDELDEATRETLLTHFLQGSTTRDIAAQTGVSQATVSRRIEAGVNQLRYVLRQRGVLVAAATLATLLGENAVQAAPAVVTQGLAKMAMVAGTAGIAAGGAASTTAQAAAAAAAGFKMKLLTAAAVGTIAVGSAVTIQYVSRQPASSDRPTSNGSFFPELTQKSAPGATETAQPSPSSRSQPSQSASGAPAAPAPPPVAAAEGQPESGGQPTPEPDAGVAAQGAATRGSGGGFGMMGGAVSTGQPGEQPPLDQVPAEGGLVFGGSGTAIPSLPTRDPNAAKGLTEDQP